MTDEFKQNDGWETPQTSWRDTLPDEIKDDPSLKDFKDVNGVAKSYLEARKLLGNSIRIPNESSSREDREKFYEQLLNEGMMPTPSGEDDSQMENLHKIMGCPEKFDDYEFSPKVMDVMKSDLDSFSQIKEFFHGIKLTKSQASMLLDRYVGERSAVEMEAGLYEKLKSTYGTSAVPMLDRAKQNIEKIAVKYPEIKHLTEDCRFMYNPAIVNIFAEMVDTGKMSGPQEVQNATNPDPMASPSHEPNSVEAMEEFHRQNPMW